MLTHLRHMRRQIARAESHESSTRPHDRAVEAAGSSRQELRRSIERGELRVYYQPIVSLVTAVMGFKRAAALAAGREVVAADEIVPIAEEPG
jgi:sensor c-di-GMP phosphodiesterase-like protein